MLSFGSKRALTRISCVPKRKTTEKTTELRGAWDSKEGRKDVREEA